MHPHAPRRTNASSVRTALTGDGHRSRFARKRFLLHLGVAGSMLIIVGLYAASAPRLLAPEPGSLTLDDIRTQFAEASTGVKQEASGLTELRDLLTTALEAKKDRSEGIEIMKSKLESATSTYEEGLSATGTHP